MFFALSKTLDFLLHPVNVLGLLSIASVVFFFFNRRRLAKLFGAGVIGGWLLVGYVPLATAILTEFENIGYSMLSSQPNENAQNISGIPKKFKITSWILFFISIIFSVLLI